MVEALTEYSEGKASFQVGQSFYRSQSQVVRDLGVLAAIVHRQQLGRLRILDTMAGCGVRSLRYCLEGEADWIWVNEGNPENGPILQQNLQSLAPDRYQLTHWDANRVFFDCYNRQDFYDFVDVDSFGAPAPHLSSALWSVAIGGLLYLTSTNGRIATGHAPETSLRVYGAYARNHPAANEQGLRLILGTVQQLAAAKGMGVQPLFSLFTGQTYRVMVRLIPQVQLTPENYGFLGYCHACGSYQTLSWRQLNRAACSCQAEVPILSGPLWLGSLHQPLFLQQMMAVAAQRKWLDRSVLLNLMAAEAELPPYFYTLREIGRRGKLNLPPKLALIETLKTAGYLASSTHIHPQAIKTTAPLSACIQFAASLDPMLAKPLNS